jgi:hypothetical protein
VPASGADASWSLVDRLKVQAKKRQATSIPAIGEISLAFFTKIRRAAAPA